MRPAPRMSIIAVVFIAAVAGYLGAVLHERHGPAINAAVLPAAAHAAGLPASVDGQPLPSLAPMLENVMPAVVNVYTASRVQVRQSPMFDDPFFRHFFGIPDMPRERIERSLGSGVIVDAARGLIVTNHHVIQGADDISITLADGRTLTAERVGSDPGTDIAIVRVPAEKLTALPLAHADELRVGAKFQVTFAIPLALLEAAALLALAGRLSRAGRSKRLPGLVVAVVILIASQNSLSGLVIDVNTPESRAAATTPKGHVAQLEALAELPDGV